MVCGIVIMEILMENEPKKLICQVYGRNWTCHMTGYLMEPIRGNKNSKRTPHERPNMLKLHKRSFSKERQSRRPFFKVMAGTKSV